MAKEHKIETLDELLETLETLETKQTACQSQEIPDEIYENYSWQQAKRDWVASSKIDEEDFDVLLDIAKTKNINDVWRLCDFFYDGVYSNNRNLRIYRDEQSALIKLERNYLLFNKGINKGVITGFEKNIYNKYVYKNVLDFEYKMDDIEYKLDVEYRKIPSINSFNVAKGSLLIYEDANWVIYEISNFDASRHYGSDTEWCISRDDSEGLARYDIYKGNGQFYFIISKRKRNDKYRKIAVQIDKYGKREYNNANNEDDYEYNIKRITQIDLDKVNW